MIMTVTRKNVPRPVITTNQQNGTDYILLLLLLLYILISIASHHYKAGTASSTIGSVHHVSDNSSMYESRDDNRTRCAG